jgi:hypothetical protein
MARRSAPEGVPFDVPVAFNTEVAHCSNAVR